MVGANANERIVKLHFSRGAASNALIKSLFNWGFFIMGRSVGTFQMQVNQIVIFQGLLDSI